MWLVGDVELVVRKFVEIIVDDVNFEVMIGIFLSEGVDVKCGF